MFKKILKLLNLNHDIIKTKNIVFYAYDCLDMFKNCIVCNESKDDEEIFRSILDVIRVYSDKHNKYVEEYNSSKFDFLPYRKMFVKH